MQTTLIEELYTDDSFAFNRAVKIPQGVVESWSSQRPVSTTIEKATAQSALMCMRHMLGMYSRQWTRPSTKLLFRLAAERRLALPEELREELDDMSTQLAKLDRRTPGAGSVVKLKKSYEYHPLRNTRDDAAATV